MSKITWLHFSDLHIRAENTVDQRIIQEEFQKDLDRQLAENNTKLNFIFFTGDVAFSASQKEYELASNNLCLSKR